MTLPAPARVAPVVLPVAPAGALPPGAAPPFVDPEGPEARRVLLGLARGRLKPIPPERLVDHVLDLHDEDGWDVQRAAFEAILRRADCARAEAWSVAERPGPRQPYGVYLTRRRGPGTPRPVGLWSLEPLRASCDCGDFLRNGLGVCVHVLAALGDLSSRPRIFAKADRASAALPSLDWDPVRPLLGADEAWQRLRFRERGPQPTFTRGWRADGEGWLRPPRGARASRVLADVEAYVRRDPSRASPAAREVVDAALDRCAARLSAKDAGRALRALGSMKRALYPYQREGVQSLLDAGRLLLADDMGLGKTAQAIGACHALAKSGAVRRGLLLVPAPLKGQWEREWAAFTDLPIVPVEGRPDARRALYRATAEGFLLVNYELLLRDAEALRAWAPELVVLDEAQRIKNADTKTAQAVKTLAPRFRLALTGTPMENNLSELASIADWVEPGALAPRWRLGPVHGTTGGARNLDTLRARLDGCFLRRRRAEILDQLPSRTDSFVPVPMTGPQASVHHKHAREIARLTQTRKKRRLTPQEELELIKHLTQQRVVADGLALRRFEEAWPELRDEPPTPERLAELFSPKLLAIRDVLSSLVVDQGRTVVVFSQWRRMLRLAEWATRDLLEGAGLRSVFFTGAESLRARDRSVVELHDDPATRVLFSTDAGGVGLNLQRAATACVHLEPAWNPAVTEQRVARIHRLGQREPIDVVHLVAPDSIEDRIVKRGSAKRALFDTLFDSDADSVTYASDVTLADEVATEVGPPPPDRDPALPPASALADAREPNPPRPAERADDGAHDTDARDSETQHADAHDTDAHHADAHDADAHHTDAHHTDAHHTDAHHADAHHADVHHTDAHHTDAHHTDAHHTDAHHTDAQRAVPQCTGARCVGPASTESVDLGVATVDAAEDGPAAESPCVGAACGPTPRAAPARVATRRTNAAPSPEVTRGRPSAISVQRADDGRLVLSGSEAATRDLAALLAELVNALRDAA